VTDFTATVSLSDIRDIAYDDSRGLLYVLTGSDTVERWNPVTHSFLGSIAISGYPTALDLTADHNDLLITGTGQYDLNVQRVNLSTFAVEQLNLAPATVPGPPTTEGYSFDIALLANGEALASTRSGFGPVREFDPEAPTISPSPIVGGSFNQFSNPTYLIASENHRYVLIIQGGFAQPSIELFDSASNQITATTGWFRNFDGHAAVSDSSGLVYWDGEVFDTQFHLVRNLTSFGSFVQGAFSRDGHDLFLWNGNTNTVDVFDTASWQQIGLLAVTLSPFAVDMETSQDGRFLFLTTSYQFEAIDLRAELYSKVVDASGGDQTLTGPGLATYANAAAGVTVSLALQGQAQNTVGAGTDTLSNFDDLTGSAFNDVLEGDGAGNTLDGGGGINTVSYAHAASGVTVRLALQGQQNTGGAGVDTLSNFQNLTGSAFNDTLEGDGGNNVLDGGGGTNTVSYAHAASGVTVSLALQGQTQNTGGAGTDILSNFQNVGGSNFADHLTGDAGDNVIDGGSGGSDVLDGGGGVNTVSFASASAGVIVSLALQGQGQATGLGTDILSNFQNLTGSAFDDTLEGDAGNNILDGGAGTNTVSYVHAAAGVNVTLALPGQAQGTGGAGTDTLLHFQNLTGSAFNDVLEGDSGNNALDGGGGVNTVSYAHASGGVNVSLALQGQAESTGGAGVDTLSNFRNLIGSAFNDVLADSSDDNVLTGAMGADTFVLGGGGADTITDFSHAQGDIINLGRFGIFHSLSDVLAASTQVGADTVITAGGSTLTLENVQRSSLTAADFSFAFTLIFSSDVVTTSGGSNLSFTSGPIVSFTAASGGTFVNNGSITLTTADTDSAIQSVSALNPAAIFQNAGSFIISDGGGTAINSVATQNSGTISISGASAPLGTSGDLINSGAFGVQGANQATGVDDANAAPQVQNQLAATLSVSATTGQAIGVRLDAAGEFDNLGTVTVSGAGQAYGVFLQDGAVSKFINSGSLSVTAPSGVGLYLGASGPLPASPPTFGTYTIANTGTITAHTAIQVADGDSAAASIHNSGTINGDVVLGNGDGYFRNSGTINGNVTINGGRFFSDGTVNGTFSLGSGTVEVYAGAEDDTILLGAGTHVVDGGAGTNTVSYAGAASGVSVSLQQLGQAQTTGVGTDTLTNIQNLTGSSFDDLLTAPATGNSVLTGGGGADNFKVGEPAANVTITDFSHADGDLILFLTQSVSNWAYIQSHAVQSGADTVISVMGSGSLTLKNVTASSLTPSDFYFGVVPGYLEVTSPTSTVTVPAGGSFESGASTLVTFDPAAGGTFINRGFLSQLGGVQGRGVSPLQPGLDPTALFENDGTFVLTGGFTAIGVVGVTLHNNGTLTVTALSAIAANGDVINTGTMSAGGTSMAVGVVDENPGGLIQNLAGGTVTAYPGPSTGIGLELAVGGEIDNAGAVTVNAPGGKGGIGLAVVDTANSGHGLGYSLVNNSGSVTVSNANGTGILMNTAPVNGSPRSCRTASTT